MEAGRACAKARFGEHVFYNSAVIRPHLFVGADAENPVSCGVVYCMVAHRREIVMPPVIDHASP
jgi:hypothetical protein